MHLAPEATLIFPTHGTAHLYTTHGAELTFHGLTRSTEQWLYNLAYGEHASAPPVEAHEVIRSLTTAGVVVPQPPSQAPAAPAPPGRKSTQHHTDIFRYADQRDMTDSRVRQRAVIAARGVTPLTVAILVECGAMGVEQYIIDDPRPPQSPGVLSTIFPPHLSREDGAANYLRQEQHATIRAVQTPADIAILHAGDEIDLLCGAVLWAEGIAHLMVRETERGVTIGPLIVPGVTGCLECCVQSLGGNVASHPSVRGETCDRSLSATTSRIARTIAAHDIVSFIDGAQPATTQHVVHVFNGSRRVVELPWSAQESCWCRSTTL